MATVMTIGFTIARSDEGFRSVTWDAHLHGSRSPGQYEVRTILAHLMERLAWGLHPYKCRFAPSNQIFAVELDQLGARDGPIEAARFLGKY
jgi:hypothetical protein